MRRAARRDDNEKAIVDALERVGCMVQKLTQGDGVPDLLVGVPSGKLIVIEVKDGDKVPSAKRLSEKELAWHQRWARYPVFVVEDVEQAVKASRWT
jgi:Holliday junction resolvase